MRASSVVMLVSLLLTSCAFSGSMASSNVRDVASTGLRPSQPLAIVPTDRGPATIAADGSVRRPYHLLRCYTTAQCCTIVGPDTGATCDETDDSPVPIPDLSMRTTRAHPVTTWHSLRRTLPHIAKRMARIYQWTARRLSRSENAWS